MSPGYYITIDKKLVHFLYKTPYKMSPIDKKLVHFLYKTPYHNATGVCSWNFGKTEHLNPRSLMQVTLQVTFFYMSYM